MDDETAPTLRAPLKRQRIVVLCVLLAAALVLALVITDGAVRVPAGPASGTHLSAPAAPSTKTRFRVATYNIHSGVGTDRRFDLGRTAAALRGFDLIGLNEVRGTLPWRSQDQARILGSSLGLPCLFAPSERQWWNDAFGNGLLTSLPVEEWQRIPLAGTPGRGIRNVVRVRLTVGGKPLYVLITHADRVTDRANQLLALTDMFLTLPEPAILMGDLNSRPADPLIERLRTSPGVTDPVGQVLGAKAPERIDWIFTRGLRIHDAGLIDSVASDHPLVWAEAEIP